MATNSRFQNNIGWTGYSLWMTSFHLPHPENGLSFSLVPRRALIGVAGEGPVRRAPAPFWAPSHSPATQLAAASVLTLRRCLAILIPRVQGCPHRPFGYDSCWEPTLAESEVYLCSQCPGSTLSSPGTQEQSRNAFPEARISSSPQNHIP